jgi:membrane protein implicated in regulation of membrane protease activity
MFLLLALVLLLFVPWPWNLVTALLSCFAFVGEIAFWQRRIRGRKVQTGVENLVGSVGEVIEPLTPVGQIRVLGELWQARASQEVPRSAPVRVLGVQGLTLEVEPADRGLQVSARS